MPLPIILGIGAAIAGIAGITSGVKGGMKMKEANDIMKSAASCQEDNIERYENQCDKTTTTMDKLGMLEMDVLHSFERFSNVFEKIKNRPEFKAYESDEVSLPKYDAKKIKEVSIGAGVLLGGIGGAGLGTAGGFAAAGATTAAVMALGTASTGTAIASLSGAAATNATLAAIGGGAIAAGGGGVALGTAILGASTLGVGLLVGGIIFNVTGSSLTKKADDAYAEMKKSESKINEICDFLTKLYNISNKFRRTISNVNKKYLQNLVYMESLVYDEGKNNWKNFSSFEKTLVQNTVMLVGLLYKMCQVKLVNNSDSDDEVNTINSKDINRSIKEAKVILLESTLE